MNFLPLPASDSPSGVGLQSQLGGVEKHLGFFNCLEPSLEALLGLEPREAGLKEAFIASMLLIANSNGHACMLQYALLHLCGYKLSMDDLKAFRVSDSNHSPQQPRILKIIFSSR